MRSRLGTVCSLAHTRAVNGSIGGDSNDRNLRQRGEHAHPEIARSIRRIASEQPGVKQVNALFAVHVGPVQVVAMLNVGFVETLAAGDVETAVELMEERIKSDHPEVEAVFVKPQSAAAYGRAV